MENKGNKAKTSLKKSTKKVTKKVDAKTASVKEEVDSLEVKVPKKTTKKVEAVDTEATESWEDDKKSVGHKIFDVIFWICIALLAFIWIFDFIQVKDGKDPKFCIKTELHEYEDGTVNECDGLGYKVFKYNRTSINIDTQFSPFFVGMKE